MIQIKLFDTKEQKIKIKNKNPCTLLYSVYNIRELCVGQTARLRTAPVQ